ncbi:hypothetical protein T459_16153 [Capsicum annuum]|uniref:Uncharacterized protein n=1 Tax=Capsicum annuum TaxID=4072 RepID=A0A2G2Z872_CAPAN|nr:hypothetical protein T459_16153 [Capsicum annuum]
MQLAEMVHFRHYTSSSSKGKHLLIEADDGMILTRLLTETPIVGRHSLRLGVQIPTHYLLQLESYPYPFRIYKIRGLPIGGVPYKEAVPKPKELTGPIVKTPQEYGEKVLIVVKPPILKSKVVIPYKVKGPSHAETQSDSSHGDHCWKKNLLGSFFGLSTSYDQVQSTLIDKTIIIKDSKTYLKAKEHLELVLWDMNEKSEEVSAACKSLKKARKKVKNFKPLRDTTKQEAVEMKSKVSTIEDEFYKCYDISLATVNASNVVEKWKQVLETALKDLVNYKLYLD